MEVVPLPTLEMVQAQFHTPSTSAQQEATRYIIQLKNVTRMLAAHIIFVDRLPAPAVLSTVHPLRGTGKWEMRKWKRGNELLVGW